jgi:hypothetical protein
VTAFLDASIRPRLERHVGRPNTTMNRIALMLALLAVLATGHLAAQAGANAPGDSTVPLRGMVVDARGGAGLARARIEVTTSPVRVIASVVTDESGAFAVDVPATTPFSITATKAGYAISTRRVTPEQLRSLESLRIELPRGGAVSGRVVDTAGELPEMSSLVVHRIAPDGSATRQGSQAISTDDRGGFQIRIPVDTLGTGEGPQLIMPDDRGEFRIGGLAAGRYVIDGVVAGLPRMARVVPVTVDVEPGAEITGVIVLFERVSAEASAPVEAGEKAAGGTIRGTVMSAAGAPVPFARVVATLIGRDDTDVNSRIPFSTGRPSATTTDTLGRFTLRGLPPGRFAVEALKPGYLKSQHGQAGANLPGLPIVVRDREEVDDVALVLARASVVSGTVVDEYGDPVQDAQVYLLRVTRSGSAAVAERDERAPVRRSDDRGEFRISGIAAGTYILGASINAGVADAAGRATEAYAPSYYPGTHDVAGAVPLHIVGEQEVPGLVLTLNRVPVVRVSGTAVNSQGLPLSGSVRLSPRRPGIVTREAPHVNPSATGAFAFAGVAPGEYRLEVIGSTGASEGEFAVAAITVGDGDPEPLRIRTSPGSKISGQIVLEGGSAGEQLWGYSVTTSSIDSSPSSAYVSTVLSPMSTGTPFTLPPVAGPTHLRFSSPDENWFVKSLLINGFDVVDTPFDFGFDGRAYTDVEVVFSRSGASVGGHATNERGADVRNYAVYVFPTDRQKWFAGSRWIRTARASAEGEFLIKSLPAGDYWIAAVDRVDVPAGTNQPLDTEFLEVLVANATRVSAAEGQTRALSLRLTRR